MFLFVITQIEQNFYGIRIKSEKVYATIQLAASFTGMPFSCDTFFEKTGDDAVMPRGYQLGGDYDVTAFTATSFFGETSFA